jgi:hypothetical protein
LHFTARRTITNRPQTASLPHIAASRNEEPPEKAAAGKIACPTARKIVVARDEILPPR